MSRQRRQKVLVYGVKGEVKVEVHPPGLCFGEMEQRFFGQIPRNLPTQTKLPKADTDSKTTDKHTTQGRKQGDHQTQFSKDERGGGNATQQLPNTGLTSFGANNWPNQNWNSIDWGSFDYYNWGMPMMYWGNIPETHDKGEQKGGAFSWMGKFTYPPDQIRRRYLILGATGI